MTDRITDLFIEFDEMGFIPTTFCPEPEEYAIEWRRKVWEEIEVLKAENAALRERLDKAVELKKSYLEEDHYGGVYEVHYETVVHKVEAYDYRSDAEKRLKELKEGKKC